MLGAQAQQKKMIETRQQCSLTTMVFNQKSDTEHTQKSLGMRKYLNENKNIPYQRLWDAVLKGEFIVLNTLYENVSIIKIQIE